jgi:hypothetical protein
MKHIPPKAGPAAAQQLGRTFPTVALAIVAIALLGGVIAYLIRERAQKETPGSEVLQPAAEETVAVPTIPEPKPTPPPPVSLPETAAPPAPAPQPPVVAPLQPAATPARPEPDAFTRQLVTSLSQLDLTSGTVTAEAAAGWRQALQQLGQKGAAAIPAIREFLERNQDMAFESVAGGNELGYPSLRLALLDVLHHVGGAEAVDLSAQTLQTATDPREIAKLGQYLEQQAPGQYQQVIANAAREALTLAESGRLESKDVGPLFGVLQQFGGPSAVSDFEKASGMWKYYSAISLASLPDGMGIPTLIQWAQGQEGSPKGNQVAALQMLAQVASQFPQAQEVLLNQARQNQIPNATWYEVASVLAGHTYQIGQHDMDPAVAAATETNVKKYHLSFGNQNYYSTQTPASLGPEQITQRLALIDQLLAATSNPVAADALQRSKNQLMGRLPAPQ